jgi:hypothetical protein
MANNLENAIALLSSARECKEFILLPGIEQADAYLTGFMAACHACGIGISWSLVHQASEARGWTVEEAGIVPGMLAQGMTAEQVVDELFEIHLQAYRNSSEANVTPNS